MISSIYYLIRSKVDGQYLAAQPNPDSADRYLLLFKENFDGLSYINKYAEDLKDKLAVESVTQHQLKSLLQRWGFTGLGMVQDPLIPKIEFLRQSRFNDA